MRRFIPWSTLNIFSITLAASINILFGSIRLINLLGIRFYYFYSPQVIDIAIFSSSTDLWIWGISLLFMVLATLAKMLLHLKLPRWIILPCILSLATSVIFLYDDRIASVFAIPLGFTVIALLIHFSNDFLEAKKLEATLLILAGVIGLLIPFEFASVSSWMLNAFDYQVPFGHGLRWKFPLIDLQLFNVLYPLLPCLFSMLLYSWIWIPASKHLISKIRTIKTPKPQALCNEKVNNRLLVIGLLLVLATSSFIAYYPYTHLPNTTLAGVDSISYYDWMKEMSEKGPISALDKDRPLFNLLMYSVGSAFGLSPAVVVRIMPIILAVCLGLAVFWFVKTGTKNERLALTASLFSSFSFHTTVGVYAYLLANWLAITETLLLMTLLLKALEENRWRNLVAATLVGLALLLTHLYTWNVVMAILFSYLVWTILRKQSPTEKKLEISHMGPFLVSNVLFYFIYTQIPFGTGVGSAEAATAGNLLSYIGIPNPFQLYNGLGLMVKNSVGGLFGNPLLLILSIAGMFVLANSAERFNRLLLLWTAIPSVTLLAISSGQDYYFRFTYLIPFQITAALGFHWALNKLKDKLKTNRDVSLMLSIASTALIVLFLMNYSLRSVDEAMTYILEP